LAPTRYVAAGGSDAASGTSAADAWATLGHAVAAAPPGAVVRVGPGFYAVGAGLARAAPLTLVAEHPALDDARNPTDPGQRSVIEAGVVSGPPGAAEPGVTPGPWVRLDAADPAVWVWAGLAAQPGWLGYAPTRAAQPTRLGLWAPRGGPAETPAAWARVLRANRTYNYGRAAVPPARHCGQVAPPPR